MLSFRQLSRSTARRTQLVQLVKGLSTSSAPSDSSMNLTSNSCADVTAPLSSATATRKPRVKESSWLTTQWKLYSQLSKFNLISLVVVTSGAGFVCAGSPFDLSLMAATCLGTGLCAGAAGTFNQVMEKDADSRMKRTQTRPLPSGKISLPAATVFGSVSGLAGVSLLWTMTNPVTAALGAANIALYAPIYTYSKRITEWNTWIGSIVGAIPPLMGYAAATGGSLAHANPWAMASLLFLWQFPHFFALSWLHREDYARGNFAMVPVNDITGDRTASLIHNYSLAMALFPIVSAGMGWTSYMFAVEGVAANAYLLTLTKKFTNDHTNANARRIFLCSLWYLPLLLAGFLFHNRVWDEQGDELRESDPLAQYLHQAREKLRSMCMHEMIVESDTNSAPELCFKTGVDETAAKTAQAAELIIDEASAKVVVINNQRVE